jgi:HAD superfamily hydrolase (TIGR01549 family)
VSPQAVLFDWRGILVADPDNEWWIARAFNQLGRAVPAVEELSTIAAAINAVGHQPEFALALRTADCSAALHAEITLRIFAAAGLDDDLAMALYELDFESDSHPYAADARETLQTLAGHEIKVAVISDIHFDFRSEFDAQGLTEFVDSFVLSFELGIQKPDRVIFQRALDDLGVQPAEALMVGDRADHDGGAVALGVPTLLLPTLRDPSQRRLHLVLGLAHVH